MKIRIEAGNLYDPKNNRWGEPADLHIEGDRLVDYLPRADLVIDAHGKAVMPGAIDIHCHAAAFGMHCLRLHRLHPTPEEIGRFYAQMGFTHINEPLMSVTTAPFVHHELGKIPLVDSSALLLLPVRDLASFVREGQSVEAAAAVAYLIRASKAIGIKLFEPELRYRQEIYTHLNLDIEAVVNFFSDVARACRSRLVLHSSPQLLSADLCRPESLYFAHLGPALQGDLEMARVGELLEAGARGDMGLFYPGRRVHLCLEPEAGAEVLFRVEMGFSRPLCFVRLDPSREELGGKAMQLALGPGRGRLAFSLDCASLAWPLAFTALFSRLLQGEQEPGYSLGELVAATRQLPAELLGLADKGHLGPGAQADIAIYEVNEQMSPEELSEGLRRCQLLLKGGKVVITDYKWTGEEPEKQTYWRDLEVAEPECGRRILEGTTFRADSLEVGRSLAGKLRPVPA